MQQLDVNTGLTPTAKSVEEWLNEVNYAPDPSYIPSDFALEFLAFIKLVNGAEGEENKSPVIHCKILDSFVDENPYVANMCSRGMAKTTLTEYLFLYLGVYGHIPGFGDVPLAMYVSDSIDNGVKNMRKNLEHRWANSEFLQTYVPKIKFTDTRWEFINIEGKHFVVKGYGAKALSLDTELFTPYGKTTIRECQVGDEIFGADGKLTRITKKSEIFHKPMYRIQLEDGRCLKVSEDHLNPVVLKENLHNKAKYSDYVLSTLDLLEQPLLFSRKRKRKGKPDYISNERTMFVRNVEPMVYPEVELPIDPYTLGVILGDGRIRKDCGSVELTCHFEELHHYHTHIPYAFGSLYKDPRSNAVTQSIRGLGKTLVKLGLNVRGELKFIPESYFYSSIEQRLALVQGLMDTDGTCSANGRTTFTSSSHQLCDDLACIIRSLGGTAFISKHSHAEAWCVEIWSEFPLFRLPRKALNNKPRTRLVAVESITPIEQEPSQCIAVDNEERQFIADCYFRTHNTGVRGAKEMGQRPYLAVLDDLISDEDARSATVITSVEDTIYKAIDYALHPQRHKIIWSGTPFNARDPLYKAVESGAWKVNVFPVCEEFPCTREEFRGAWEDRFDYGYVKAKYEKALLQGKIDTFNQELMLRIMSDDDRLIQDNDIRWFSRDTVIRNLHNFNVYITTDFAVSEKTSADYSIVGVWAYSAEGSWYLIDGICVRQTLDKSLDDLFRLAQMYKPIGVGIEVTGQQGGFIPFIKNMMIERNIFFPLTSEGNNNNPGIRPSTNKFTRFSTVVPLFKAGKIYFPEEMKDTALIKEAINELTLASHGGFKSKHDDFIDIVSMLSLMKAWKPSNDVPLVYNEESKIWEVDYDNQLDAGLDSYSNYIV